MSNNPKSTLAMSVLYNSLKVVAEDLDRDATLLQVLMFVRTAMAGELGFDPSVFENEFKIASATTTRTSAKLTDRDAQKNAGYDVARLDFNPDNRSKRLLRLTSKGEKAVAKIAAALEKMIPVQKKTIPVEKEKR